MFQKSRAFPKQIDFPYKKGYTHRKETAEVPRHKKNDEKFVCDDEKLNFRVAIFPVKVCLTSFTVGFDILTNAPVGFDVLTSAPVGFDILTSAPVGFHILTSVTVGFQIFLRQTTISSF